MFFENDLIPISSLQHFSFCERQCALIHIERIWTENYFTAQGRVMHEKVHKEISEFRSGVKIEYGLSLRSSKLGLIGQADVVEFYQKEDRGWYPFPIEYKLGKPKEDHCDLVQLCAQALCLEEMYNKEIFNGSIFYGKIRRRLNVIFNQSIREETENLIVKLRKFLDIKQTPKPIYNFKCDACSLRDWCMPKVMEKKKSINKYLSEVIGKDEKIS